MIRKIVTVKVDLGNGQHVGGGFEFLEDHPQFRDTDIVAHDDLFVSLQEFCSLAEQVGEIRQYLLDNDYLTDE